MNLFGHAIISTLGYTAGVRSNSGVAHKRYIFFLKSFLKNIIVPILCHYRYYKEFTHC